MMIETDLIRQVEELSMNAWPALQTLHDDGWVLRYADGYTRRANAVYPLYAGRKSLQKKIRACEAFYRAKGQRVIFKLTEASLPTALDETLAAYGYETDAQTAVQLLDLRRWDGAPPTSTLPTVAVHRLDVVLSETLGGDWLAAYARMSNIKDEEMVTHGQILSAIIPAKRFATISVDDKIIACGLGILQNGWVGFYDIRTDSAFRRQGHAYGVMAALLAWAKAEGAVHGYLQVMVDNPPALALYEKLGFREAYRYWYRVKSF
jgi:ribosomal protein S18 acetylase RimI-like enzyme